jgi:ParB/RepB/Spo0J family partition protein
LDEDCVELVSAAEVTMIPAAAIVTAENDRKRFDQTELEALAAAIDTVPHTVPWPTVRPMGDRYELVCGERRTRAMRDVLGWPEIPCQVKELTDAQARAVMLAENENRVQLDPFEQAGAYGRRIELDGISVADLARSLGRPASFVERRLLLLACTALVCDAVRAHTLPIGAAESIGAAKLDGDHQLGALRAWNTTRPRLTIESFATLVERLRDDQDQATFGFELQVETWTAQAVAETALKHAPPVVLGRRQVAGLLGVKLHTVDVWRQRGIFPAPDLTVDATDAWYSATVTTWAIETGRQLERPDQPHP